MRANETEEEESLRLTQTATRMKKRDCREEKLTPIGVELCVNLSLNDNEENEFNKIELEQSFAIPQHIISL